MTLYEREREKYQEGKEEGIKIGREDGIEEGIEKAKIENARALLDILDDNTISERIGLSLNKVKELRSQNK